VQPVDVEGPEDSTACAIGPGAVYTWDALAQRFVLASDIVPGKGYSVAASQGCLLSIPSPE